MPRRPCITLGFGVYWHALFQLTFNFQHVSELWESCTAMDCIACGSSWLIVFFHIGEFTDENWRLSSRIIKISAVCILKKYACMLNFFLQSSWPPKNFLDCWTLYSHFQCVFYKKLMTRCCNIGIFNSKLCSSLNFLKLNLWLIFWLNQVQRLLLDDFRVIPRLSGTQISATSSVLL